MRKSITWLCTLLLAPTVALTGCAFFEEPLNDLGDITPGPPPASDPQPSSGPVTISTLPPPPTPATVPAQTTAPVTPGTTTLPKPIADNTPPTRAGTGSWLSVASIDAIPEDAQNLAVVHFSRTGRDRDTNRDLAMCKAMLERLPVTPVANIPANPALLVLWPVSSGSGDTCLEMMTNYEPIDISNETAVRVNNSVAGPFLLTRNSALGKRMIFDLSYIPEQSLARGISEWQSLLGSDPVNWPGYRSAR